MHTRIFILGKESDSENVLKTDADGEHVVDGTSAPDIFPHSHSYHVPLFTLSVSIIEVRLRKSMKNRNLNNIT